MWKVNCFNYHSNNNNWFEFELTVDYKLWPCCVYTSKSPDGITGDEYIDSLPKDWNDASKHSLEEIMQHPVFKEYLTDEYWQDEKKCPKVCARRCGKPK